MIVPYEETQVAVTMTDGIAGLVGLDGAA